MTDARKAALEVIEQRLAQIAERVRLTNSWDATLLDDVSDSVADLRSSLLEPAGEPIKVNPEMYDFLVATQNRVGTDCIKLYRLPSTDGESDGK